METHKKSILSQALINILLVVLSGFESGRRFFLALPSMLLVNLVFTIYFIFRKSYKAVVIAVVIAVLGPVAGFVLFHMVFPMLVR